jgi:hypothetical protein
MSNRGKRSHKELKSTGRPAGRHRITKIEDRPTFGSLNEGAMLTYGGRSIGTQRLENQDFNGWMTSGAMPRGTQAKVIKKTRTETLLLVSAPVSMFSGDKPVVCKSKILNSKVIPEDFLVTRKDTKPLDLSFAYSHSRDGKMPKLDLHGVSHSDALGRVCDFIIKINQKKEFPVVIVTGKSKRMKQIALKAMDFIPYLTPRGGVEAVLQSDCGSIIFDYEGSTEVSYREMVLS